MQKELTVWTAGQSLVVTSLYVLVVVLFFWSFMLMPVISTIGIVAAVTVQTSFWRRQSVAAVRRSNPRD